MIAESLARRYAVALFHLAVEKDRLDRIKDEFQVLCDLIGANEKFRYFLHSPKMDREEKKRVIDSIFGGRISKTLLHFLFLLLDKKRQTLLEKIYSHFDTLYCNYHNRATITVRPAVSLEDSILSEIRQGFEKRLGKSITVMEEVDAALIGGLQVRVNNTVYDASILGRLRRLQRQIS